MLTRLYMSHEHYFKSLVPHSGWDSDEEEELFGYWLKTWLWTSLADQCGVEGNLTGYIALCRTSGPSDPRSRV